MNQEVGNQDLMDKLISLCKQRGIIFPGSEIYGGLANSWDFGPYGALLKNNIRQAWIKHFVTSRDDMVLLESGVIMNPKVWEASGHLQNFTDPLVDCKKCHKRFRADHILEQKSLEPGYAKEAPLDWAKITCPECGGELTEVTFLADGIIEGILSLPFGVMNILLRISEIEHIEVENALSLLKNYIL